MLFVCRCKRQAALLVAVRVKGGAPGNDYDIQERWRGVPGVWGRRGVARLSGMFSGNRIITC